MTATYDVRLVALSIVIAVLASYTAMDLAGRVMAVQGRERKLWVAGGAIAMGVGIWSMHFIAMLAYNLTIPIAYNLPIVLVSMAVAVVASGAALFVVSRQKMGGLQLLAGSVFMGLGIAAMHYTGMVAMQLGAKPLYNLSLVALSIAIAIGASLIALWLAFHLRTETTSRGCVRKIGSAIIMGNAIAGMHYTAMAAVSFQPTNQSMAPPSHAMDNSLLAVGVGIATLVILTLALIASFFDQRLSTETARAEAFRQSEQRFRSLVQNASDVIAIQGPTGIIYYASESIHRVLGYRCEDVVSSNILSLVHPDDTAQMKNFFAECLANLGVTPLIELRFRHGDGQWCYVEAIGNNLLDEPSVGGIVLNFRDISERKRAQEQLRHNAFHDPLTDLPNRALFMDRLEQAVKRAKRHEDYLFAVLFLDLDRFKLVNDSLGHMVGDELLIAIAHRLEVCLRPGDTVARLGGDEFTVLLDGVEDLSDANRIADRIQKELRLPFNLSGQEVFTAVSIGIALSATGYDQPEDFLRDADTAMYRAKALGKARYHVFDTAMHEQAVTRLQMETDLRRAIERQEFRVHYQPIVFLETGRTIGFEALLRWEHPKRGLISPGEFIPVAEETGLLVPIGQWVLCEACRQMRVWQVRFPTSPPLRISVNFSVKELTQPDLIEQIAQILHETSLDASSLKLELTESVLLENTETATTLLKRLKALGMELYLDDFGTGYSSLSYLHQFPINALKIDRAFVSRINVCNESWQIVQAITMLANALGMDVIAEGVETFEQLAQLSALQCKYGQGNFFSKPLDGATANVWIAQKVRSMDNSFVLPL
jgi:diguanylate cyclase (GGDEF)-like protein/PAS domain S-box-containing protein